MPKSPAGLQNPPGKGIPPSCSSPEPRPSLSRDDGSAQRKQLLLRWCQGAELLELLPFHGCDSAAEPRRAQCLLGLQAQHVRARFAVFLTGEGTQPCSSGRALERGGEG